MLTTPVASESKGNLAENTNQSINGEKIAHSHGSSMERQTQEASSQQAPQTDFSGIESIRDGQGFERDSTATEPLSYKCALEVLKASEDGGRCNFPGRVMLCEDYPRDVGYADNSPRKRIKKQRCVHASRQDSDAYDTIYLHVGAAFPLARSFQLKQTWSRGGR